ncbi:hypothetical protein ASE00_14520 [Sphingomonas sp. Root710]|uniref:hypothetical protein n=1 Tax=Sphingomonas sp. Root710 TaxID=1736594 RepID=UPI0006FF494C|nr:hypothetical protein [Sphingomonas sp. Root710]KRB81214.1 hypothetical protein ASE00_14520 [Sphingomonas sp. Root710]
MIGYRVYIMDCNGIHIEDVAAIMADGDADAIRTATQRRDRQPWELWQGGRMVEKSTGLKLAA